MMTSLLRDYGMTGLRYDGIMLLRDNVITGLWDYVILVFLLNVSCSITIGIIAATPEFFA